MGGFFAVASKESCVLDLFYGTDYHSHLGTRRGGMAVHGENGFSRAIHNIQYSPFRTKFERDVEELEGNLGIGCISDFEPQPLLVHSHLGSFAITTVGKINNSDELINECYNNGNTHFLEMSGGTINPTEITVEVSKDGSEYQTVANETYEVFGQNNPDGRYDYKLAFPETDCRFLHIVAKPVESMPDWHPGHGSDAFIFVDEITVE